MHFPVLAAPLRQGRGASVPSAERHKSGCRHIQVARRQAIVYPDGIEIVDREADFYETNQCAH